MQYMRANERYRRAFRTFIDLEMSSLRKYCGRRRVYAPCEQCYERFVVIVNRIPLSNMVAAGKCIHRGVVEIKRTLDRGEPVIIENLNLEEALLMLRSLQSLDCDCESKPDPSEMFPDILNCTARIPISRL